MPRVQIFKTDGVSQNGVPIDEDPELPDWYEEQWENDRATLEDPVANEVQMNELVLAWLDPGGIFGTWIDPDLGQLLDRRDQLQNRIETLTEEIGKLKKDLSNVKRDIQSMTHTKSNRSRGRPTRDDYHKQLTYACVRLWSHYVMLALAVDNATQISKKLNELMTLNAISDGEDRYIPSTWKSYLKGKRSVYPKTLKLVDQLLTKERVPKNLFDSVQSYASLIEKLNAKGEN